MTRIKYTQKATVSEMVDSLVSAAEDANVSLNGITIDNFNGFLDDALRDGGETRCEKFLDLADDYALQFGPFESMEYYGAAERCIRAALREIKQNG